MTISPETAASALSFTGTASPRLNWPSVVTRSLAPVSCTRSFSVWAETPEDEGVDGTDAGTAKVMMMVSTMTGRLMTTLHRCQCPAPPANHSMAGTRSSSVAD